MLCSSRVLSFISITRFSYPPPTYLLVTMSVFFIVKILSFFLFLSLYFSPLLFCFISLIPHTNDIIWYLSFSYLLRLALYFLALSTSLQMTKFHCFLNVKWKHTYSQCCSKHAVKVGAKCWYIEQGAGHQLPWPISVSLKHHWNTSQLWQTTWVSTCHFLLLI